jgi:hypothetical protein
MPFRSLLATLFLSACLCALLVSRPAGLSANAPPVPLPSLAEPSIAPDGSEIAFVSAGDIWSVPASGGAAHLLVSHPAAAS